MRTARAKSGVRQALLAGFRLRRTQSRPDIWGWAGQSGMDMYWRRMIESMSARVFCLLDAPGIFYFSLRHGNGKPLRSILRNKKTLLGGRAHGNNVMPCHDVQTDCARNPQARHRRRLAAVTGLED